MTAHNTQVKNMWGVIRIADAHENNNLSIRDALIENDIIPENLLPAEDTKKVEKRLDKAVRITIATAEELPSTNPSTVQNQ